MGKYFLIGCVFTISCGPRTGQVLPINEEAKLEKTDLLPRIDGNPLSALPIADPQLKVAWAVGKEMLEPKPPLPAPNAKAKESAHWLREFNDWTRLFFSARHQLIKRFGELNANKEVNLFSNLLFANIDARFIETLKTIVPPEALSKRSKDLVQQSIDLKISVLLNAALAEYQSAADGLTRAHPLMQGWKDICASNRTMLRTMIPNYDRIALEKKVISAGYLFDEPAAFCEMKPSSQFSTFRGNPSDPKKKQRLVLFIDPDVEKIFASNERGLKKFRNNIYKNIRSLTKARPISMADVEKAERLVREKKISQTGNVCGEEAPIEAVLQMEYKNLLIAQVQTQHVTNACLEYSEVERRMVKKKGCIQNEKLFLKVGINAYGYPRFFDTRSLEVALKTADTTKAKDWIRASKELKSPRSRNLLGALMGLSVNSSFYSTRRFYHRRPENSWFEEGRKLDALKACNLSQETMSYDLSWTISPQGASENIEVSWVEAPSDQQKEAKACLEKSLKEMPWRCPQDGKSQVEKVRVCEQSYHGWRN